MAILSYVPRAATMLLGVLVSIQAAEAVADQKSQDRPKSRTRQQASQPEQQPQVAEQERKVLPAAPIELINHPRVQAELTLGRRQKAQLANLTERIQAQRASLSNPPRLPRDVRRLQETKLNRQAEEGIEDILEQPQQTRFRQILLQALGYSAVARPEVGEALKLSGEQVSMVRQATRLRHQRSNDQYPSETPSNTGSRRRRGSDKEWQTWFNGRMEAILTSEQKSRWKQLLGKPLVLVEPAATPESPYAAVPASKHTKDSLDEVRELLDQDKAVLADVREQDEWDKGHLAEAVLIPLSELRAGADEKTLPKALAQKLPKDKVIYCHCRSGRRVLVAAEILGKKGYDVRPLEAGYFDLLGAGFPKAKR